MLKKKVVWIVMLLMLPVGVFALNTTSTGTNCSIVASYDRDNVQYRNLTVTALSFANDGTPENHSLELNCFYTNGTSLFSPDFSNVSEGKYLNSIDTFLESGLCYVADTASQCSASAIIWNESDGGKPVLMIALAILAFAMMGFLSYFGWTFTQVSSDDYTYYLSYLLWYIALLIPLFIIRMIERSLDPSLTQILSLLNTFYVVYMIFYGFMVLMLVVYFFVMYMSWLKWNKQPAWKQRKLKL